MPGVPVEDATWLTEYDGYYYDSSGTRSLPVLRVRYADAQQTWLYLDPARGGIVQRSEKITPAPTLAVSGPAQPRLSVPLLHAPAVGHRRHRAEPGRAGAERDDVHAGVAPPQRHAVGWATVFARRRPAPARQVVRP